MSVVQDSRKQFVQRWQSTYRVIVSDIFFVPFFVDNFDPYSAPCFWCAVFLLEHFVEQKGFAFLELVDCCLKFIISDHMYFFVVTFTIVFSSSSALFS